MPDTQSEINQRFAILNKRLQTVITNTMAKIPVDPPHVGYFHDVNALLDVLTIVCEDHGGNLFGEYMAMEINSMRDAFSSDVNATLDNIIQLVKTNQRLLAIAELDRLLTELTSKYNANLAVH